MVQIPVFRFLHGSVNQIWHFNFGYEFKDGKVSGARRCIWDVDSDRQAHCSTADQWNETAEIAQKRRMAPVCLQCLFSAQSTLGTNVPNEIISRLEASPQSI